MDQAAIVRTGVELSLDCDATDAAIDATHRRELTARERVRKVALVWARSFADLVLDGKPQQSDGNERHTYIELDRDPTNQLMEVVNEERWNNLMNLYADIAHGDELGITRWEFYGAPFHVELSQELKDRLAGAWQPRPPRLPPDS